MDYERQFGLCVSASGYFEKAGEELFITYGEETGATVYLYSS